MDSKLNTAYKILVRANKPIEFDALYNEVCKLCGLPRDKETREKEKSPFYTSLVFDGRFVNIGDNSWYLKSLQSYEKVRIDLTEAYTDLIDEEEEMLDEDEDKTDDDAFGGDSEDDNYFNETDPE